MNKNIIIFCRQEGCTGISYIGDLDTEFSARMMSNDINEIASIANIHGVKIIVCSTTVRPWVKNSLLFKSMVSNDVTIVGLGEINKYIKDSIGIVTLGVPAKAGTLNAFLCGTWNHIGWHDYLLDDEPVGEISIYKKYANSYNIPLIAVIGDAAVCDEAISLDKNISTFATKTANARNVAICEDIEKSREGIKECIMNALKNYEKCEISEVNYPLKVTVQYNRTDFCDDAYRISIYSLDRSGSRTLSKRINQINGIGDFVF